MATAATGTSRPGLTVGPTSEFSLFFRVIPGHGEALRAALRDLQDTPGYRPGDYDMAIATIHEARFVLFDDDTRLAFVTSFDGPWDAYMEDFFTSGPTLALFDVIFRHTEGYEGLPDRAALRAFVLGAQQTAAAYARNYGGTVEGDPEGPARQRGLPAGAGPPGRRGGARSTPRCGRCWTRPPTSRPADEPGPRTPMSDHISGPRALAEPIADITDVYAFPSPERPGHLVLVMNTLPFAQPVGRAVRRAGLPLPAAPADRGRARPTRSRSPSRPEEFVVDCVFSPPAAAAGGQRRASRRAPAPPRPARPSRSAVNDEQGGSGHGVRVFAGPRWDPFIMDARAALTTIATGELAFTDPGSIFLDGKNVLSLVVEVDCALLGGARAGRRRGRDAHPRQVHRADRARGAARGEEHDAGAEAVRPGEPGPRDPRPLQPGGRVPPRADLPGRLPGAAERQPRLLGRARRPHRLAGRRQRRPPADGPRARRLPRRRRHQALRRAGLVPGDRARRPRREGRTRPAAAGRSTTT